MIRLALPIALLVAAAPAFADEVSGTVLAYDRVAHVIVEDDKTVFNIPNPEAIPEGLVAGDMITIDYQSDGDNGLTKILSIIINN